MSTLDTLFKLHDGYTKTIGKVISSTDKMERKVMSASKHTDKLDQTIGRVGHDVSGINKATKAVGGFIAVAALAAGAKFAIDVSDEYINTKARLDIMNDGLQTTEELQDKIMNAAERSRGSYTSMASSIAKMGILAGDAFEGNNEVIAFTELVQKSFKVGGAGTQEQQSGMYQLTQAMAAGKLQGDEFRSIMENAPLIADAISKYTGVSKGKLKELSSDGVITSDIIKNAMFYMADDINDKFASMPKTFGDYWNQIKNGAIEAFDPIIIKVSELINTQAFQGFVDLMIGGFNLMAIGLEGIINGFIWLGQVVQENWSIVQPILISMGIVLFTLFTMTLIKLGQIAVAWLVSFWPITLVIGLLGILIYWVMEFGDTFTKVCEYVSGSIYVLMAVFNNLAIGVYNTFIAVADIIDNTITAMVNVTILGINGIIGALNKIPGVEIGSVSEFEGLITEGSYGKYQNLGDAWNQGKAAGNDFASGIRGGVDGLANLTQGAFDKVFGSPMGVPASSGGVDDDISKYFDGGALPVTGGKGKKPLKVKVDKEDIKYIKDLADREYVNKFSTATLAPQVQVTFGDIKETADAEQVKGVVETILREEIAIIQEG